MVGYRSLVKCLGSLSVLTRDVGLGPVYTLNATKEVILSAGSVKSPHIRASFTSSTQTLARSR